MVNLSRIGLHSPLGLEFLIPDDGVSIPPCVGRGLSSQGIYLMLLGKQRAVRVSLLNRFLKVTFIQNYQYDEVVCFEVAGPESHQYL